MKKIIKKVVKAKAPTFTIDLGEVIVKKQIGLLIESFGNGDANLLREKLNEVIACLNK